MLHFSLFYNLELSFHLLFKATLKPVTRTVYSGFFQKLSCLSFVLKLTPYFKFHDKAENPNIMQSVISPHQY